ncbi:Lipase 2 [Hypsizygus marmoreus]|uniref:GPI inositol-deacylase n=1 Tax=Hypsizygus marmoreus TaxID=39966 RepID=A0A369K6J8_HYPMA|nr:Lipase 2 [Hypsizygus marmoreus]
MPRVPSKPPILRWLGSLSSSPSPSPQSGSPPSPSLAALNEALHEPLPSIKLPKPPPLALHAPGSFHARSLSRAPPFLDSLTRSTLPTASLSPPLSTASSSRPPSPTHPLRPPSIVLSHSPPTTSSLDSLRSISTSAAATFTPPDLTSATSWWWFQSESKATVNQLLTQEDRAVSVHKQHQKHHKKYRSPRNPVVFCHGLLGFDSLTIGPAIAPMQVTHWRGIKEALEANGTEVLITRVPATSSVVDRAKVLEEKISEVYPGRSVHLIGHSMGGLDCRYLTTHLTHRKFSVLSVTTIATPHRGSSFADHFLSTVGASRMPSILSLLDLLPNGGGDGAAFECLTVASMKKFNEETPDVPGVQYFSWGAVYEPGLIDTWKWPHSVILEKEGPNDGLVSVASSKWGTYLGTLSHVNHLDLVGWINTARYKWAEIMGKEIKFRPVTFYLGIADMLAGEVEGIPREGETAAEEAGRKHREEEVREALSEAIAEENGEENEDEDDNGDDNENENDDVREEEEEEGGVMPSADGKTVMEDTKAGAGVEVLEVGKPQQV